MSELEFHSAAEIFKLIAGKEYDDLLADIRTNGLRNPITLFEGKILDGRNRYRACLEAGIEPQFTLFNGTAQQASDYGWSENNHRRHVTPSDRAAALELMRRYDATLQKRVEQIKEEAKERKWGAGKHAGRGRPKQLTQTIGEAIDPHDGESATALAKLAGANRHYMAGALTLPTETLEEIRDGKTTMSKALRRPKAKKAKGTEGRTPTKNPATTAMEFAQMAILQLQRIQPNDPNREKAFTKVETWITNQRKPK